MARPQRSIIRWLVFAPVAVLALFTSVAHATNPIITEPTDYWFEFAEPTVFIAETYMVEGVPSDPQLWLYDADGVLLISNDDYNGLQSYISLQIPAGSYRLRAGTCCWEPDVWRSGDGWNALYELSFSGVGSMQTTTTSTTSTTTTTTSTTSTTTTTSTTVPATTTTTSSTVPATTTTEPIATTSTTTASTTTIPITTTAAPTTTTTSTTTPTTTTSTTMTLPIPTTSIAATTTTTTSTTTTLLIPTISTTLPPTEQITQQQAVNAAVNSQTVATLTNEQATAVFAAIDIEQLDPAVAAAVVAAVQNAPTAVREAFEQQIDIFSGAVDSYIPIGSTVNIATRRVLVVSCAFLIAIPPMPPPRKS